MQAVSIIGKCKPEVSICIMTLLSIWDFSLTTWVLYCLFKKTQTHTGTALIWTRKTKTQYYWTFFHNIREYIYEYISKQKWKYKLFITFPTTYLPQTTEHVASCFHQHGYACCSCNIMCVFRHVCMAFQIIADKTLIWMEIIFDLKSKCFWPREQKKIMIMIIIIIIIIFIVVDSSHY